MSKTRRLWLLSFSLIPVAFLTSCATGPDNNQNSLRPKGDSAEKILNLFAPIFWLATVIGVLVLVATIFVGIKFRATKKNKSPKQIHGNSILEISWTILPLIILIGIAIPTVNTIFELNRKAEPDATRVEVTGKQWWWQFAANTEDYPLYNIDGTAKIDAEGNAEMAKKVVTANELVIPVNRQIELELKGCDGETPVIGKTTDELKQANPCNVIHSFWIPSLGGKADAVPGRSNRLLLESDEKGVFTGQCAEYCGLSHGVMRMQVRVVSEEQYEAWLANLKKPPVEVSAALEGETPTAAQAAIQKFECANCHSFDDPSGVSYGPNLTHFGPDFENEVLGGGSIEKTKERTWKWIHNATDWENGNGIPMQADDCRLGVSPGEGKRCNGMPNFSVPYSFISQENKKETKPAMTPAEAKAIATYLYNNK